MSTTTATGPAGTPSPYAWNNAHPEALNQLHHLAAVLDRHTTGVLDTVGVRAGQRWLDLAPGLGTITTWLSNRVGPLGHVDAIDIDPRYVPARDNVTIRTANILDTTLPSGHYDGIHVRLLLEHLPQRDDVLAQLVDALAPGAPLIVTEWDTDWRNLVLHSPSPTITDLLDTFQHHLIGIGEAAGMDGSWARRVHPAMRRLGMTDVLTLTDAQSWTGGTGICLLHRSNSIQQQPGLLKAGMTADDLACLRRVLADPALVLAGYLTQTTVGRRPPVLS